MYHLLSKEAVIAVETRDHLSNGVSPKDHTSRRNNLNFSNMRKIVTMLVAIAMVFAFSSCQKEGVYNPKEKISEIYNQYSSSTTYQNYPEMDNEYLGDKKLSETWTWDKNLLTKITYPNSSYYVDFKYDGKRLSKVIMDETTMTYVYSGSKIDKINIVSEEDDNYMTGAFDYTYKGSKVSRIVLTMNYVEEDWEKKAKIQRLVLPALVCDILDKTEKKMKQKGTKATTYTDTYTIDFEWDGDNVSTIKLAVKSPEEGWGYTETTTCTYDKKLNPYYHSPLTLDLEFDSFSKNNLTKAVTTGIETRPEQGVGEPTTYEVNYTYEYDGKFPVKQISEEIDIRNDEYMGTITTKSTHVTYFVYK